MNTQRNRERFDSELVLKASSTETANTTGEAKAFYSIPETCMAKVYTSELSGTDPSLDIMIEGSNDNSEWMPLVKRAMKYDFSWRRSAEKYLSLYKKIITKERI